MQANFVSKARCPVSHDGTLPPTFLKSLDLLAVVCVAVARLIAALSVVYDHANRQRARGLAGTDVARIEAALNASYRADNTRRAYLAGWKRWHAWARDHDLRALPADPASVAPTSPTGPSPARRQRLCAWIALRSAQRIAPLRLSIPPPMKRSGA